jgi:hypothetical protein
MYLYPNITLDPQQYWFGQVLPDFSVTGGVSAAVSIKSTWKASSAILKYTPGIGVS